MSTISIRIDKEMNNLIDIFAKENNTTKTEFIKQAIIDKFEDIYDIKIADEKYEEWVNNGKKTYSYSEIMEMLGI